MTASPSGFASGELLGTGLHAVGVLGLFTLWRGSGVRSQGRFRLNGLWLFSTGIAETSERVKFLIVLPGEVLASRHLEPIFGGLQKILKRRPKISETIFSNRS